MNRALLPLRKEKHFRISEWSKHHTVAASWYLSPFYTLLIIPEKWKMSPLSSNLNLPTTVAVFFVWTAAGGSGENEDFTYS